MIRRCTRVLALRPVWRRLCALTVAMIAAAALVPAFGQDRIADIRQGTNMTLALAPDGETLVLSLLGRLWQMPASGGGAVPLTPEDEAARHPRISPDGRSVVYQRYIDGRWDLWLLDLESRSRRELTAAPHNEREPDFTPDGRAVVFASDSDGRYSLWRLDIAGNVLTRLTAEPGDASFPGVSEREEIAYVLQQGERWTLRVLTPRGASVELASSPHRLSAPSWRPGGGVVVYNEHEGTRSSTTRMLLLDSEPLARQLTRSEDVFAARAAWLSPSEYLYAADGQIWRRGLAQVARSPVHLFAAVSVPSHEPPRIRAAFDGDGTHEAAGVSGYARTRDGRREAFTALGNLWLREGDAPLRRLTDGAQLDFEPSFTPDGESIVFASDRGGSIDLWQFDLRTEGITRLTRSSAKASRPAVSPDGRRVAFLETDGLGPWAPGTLKTIGLNQSDTNVRTLAQGLIDAEQPIWDPQSERIGVPAARAGASTRSIAWFDAGSGQPTAPGTLPDPAGDARQDLSGVTWQSQAGADAYVVQVGRLFDGFRSDYLRHVDIHIEGQRITAIVGRGVLPLPETVIDARDMTVVPGFIDLHAHHSSLAGGRLGRIWLAYGVTTVREIATDLMEALERAEAWSSGRRAGPRLIVSPGTTGEIAPRNAEAPPPIVVERYPGISSGLGHNLLQQSRKLRISPWPEAPMLAALEQGRADRSGFEPFEVSPLSYSYQDVLGTAIAAGTVITPTLGALGGLRSLGREWNGALRDPAYELLYEPAERAAWGTGVDGATSLIPALQEKVARIVRGGGRVAAGTDAPAVPYGLGLHAELALLAHAGIPNDQVLRIATAQAALALGLDEHAGTLEAGKLADFVVLNGDPLARIADTLNIVAVVKGGIWLDRERLLRQP
jgi:Tol biopolymer transport system component